MWRILMPGRWMRCCMRSNIASNWRWRDRLAELMAEGVRHAPRPDWLAPIPLSAARLRERGFNQSEELARQLGKILRLPCHADTLLRTRDTRRRPG